MGEGGGGTEGGVFDFKDTTGRDYLSLYLLLCQVRVPAADSGPCCGLLSANEFPLCAESTPLFVECRSYTSK